MNWARAAQRAVAGLPSPRAMVDAVAVLALTMVAMTALAGTFDGPGFLVVSLLGAFTGVGCAAATTRLRAPSAAVVIPMALALLVIGPPVTLRATVTGGAPGLDAARQMGSILVGGWKDLLTTLPPLDSSGRLSGVPFVLALLSGVAGFLLARRTRSPYLPVLGPLAGAAGAILCGLATAGGLLPRALVFVVVAMVWGTERRRRHVVTAPGAGTRRPVIGMALLAATAAVVALVSPVAAGSAVSRTVLRDRVVAPVDLSDTASPLASFRRFRPVAGDLADQTLFTVTGLAAGVPVRLATVDAYAGTVWAAGTRPAPVPADGPVASPSRFLRVGSRIPATAPGRPVSATITIGPAYAASSDLRVWLPDVGAPTRLRFEGASAPDREEQLRFNPATGAALVLGGVSAGDRYRIDAVVTDAGAPSAPGEVGDPTAPTGYAAVTAKLVAVAAAGTTNPIDAVRAVASRLKATGAYTDGGGAEATFLAGHSLGRLTSFLGDGEPVGNDEQYAATLALSAAYAGLPSRVVLAAVPDATGVVRGRDVRAWVEVQVDRQTWWSIPPEQFVPPRDRRPTPRQTLEQDRSESAVVPPPNALRPPSSVEGFTVDSSSSSRARAQVGEQGWALPAWAVLALQVAGFPLSALLAWTLALVAVKAARRARRRRWGSADERVAAAWSEVVGLFQDAGARVSTRHTRSELAREVPGLGVAQFAALTDRLAFGPDAASDGDAEDVWAQVLRVRGQLRASLRWRDRWRAAVSLRSLSAQHRLGAPLSPSRVQLDRLTSPSLQPAGPA